jgi:hypothetical protein
MRPFAAIFCALALVAGCTSSATPNPGGATTAAPPTTASPSSTKAPGAPASPMPSASPVALKAKVTFDGKNCVYSGPTVIPSPATLTIEYAPTPALEGSQVFTAAIRSDTTAADVAREDADPSSGVALDKDPEWVDPYTFMSKVGSGSEQFLLQVLRNPDGRTGVFDKVIVSCLVTMPGKPAPGSTILQLVESSAPAPSTAP